MQNTLIVLYKNFVFIIMILSPVILGYFPPFVKINFFTITAHKSHCS
jgi:hypothetical protein